MAWSLLVVAASSGVPLGEELGTARASARQLTATTMELELEVAGAGEGSVIAYLIEPGGDQQTVPLPDRGDGRFGIVIEVRRVDYVVVFELLGDSPARSEPHLLTDLGLDPTILGILPATSTTVDGFSDKTRRWGWAGLALAALALALVAVWALPDRGRRTVQVESAPPPEELSPPTP
jgi:hypothetical protein